MDEIRYWQYQWRNEREKYIKKGMKDYLSKEEGEIMLHHNKKVEKIGKTIDSIDSDSHQTNKI